DPDTSERLHDALFRVCQEERAAMVLVTHDLGLAARADRVLRLHDLLFAVCREEGADMVLVTHDLGLAARADRVLRLHGGQLVAVGPEAGPAQAAE
ncbi:MAG TPA: hypothetical protein VEQ60_19675, partial [Longimicrobium sp.]|nr:hypothetical protein [Longimicrobium sp.]